MGKRIRAMLHIDSDVIADLQELAAALKTKAVRTGRPASEADNMSDIAEAGIRAEIARRKRKRK